MYAVDGGGLELAQRFIMCAALVHDLVPCVRLQVKPNSYIYELYGFRVCVQHFAGDDSSMKDSIELVGFVVVLLEVWNRRGHMPFNEGKKHAQLRADVVALSSDEVSERAERDRQRGDVIYNLADAPGQLLSFVSSMAAPLAYLGATRSVSLREAGPGLDRPSLFPRETTIQFLDENIHEEIE